MQYFTVVTDRICLKKRRSVVLMVETLYTFSPAEKGTA